MDEYEKVDLAVKDCKRISIKLTNKARLSLLSSKKAAEELQEVILDNPLQKYLDVEGWLKSTNPRPVYKYEEAQYLSQGVCNPCLILEHKARFGNEYVTVADLHTGKVMDIESSRIKPVEEDINDKN